ncbi:MAG TPA: Ig-like domain-containing protein, partial [Candidatus Saccharibacteria bacterium]|nr:Ig-like domain-containing protein [Candidatus Saccharibacteria bacterium]
MTSPTSGQTVSGTRTVTANASDNVGVSSVSFFLDGSTTPIATDTTSPYSFSWNTTTVTNGAHTL